MPAAFNTTPLAFSAAPVALHATTSAVPAVPTAFHAPVGHPATSPVAGVASAGYPAESFVPIEPSAGPMMVDGREPVRESPAGHILTLNVGPAGIRDSFTAILPLFRDLPAVVFVQEARLPATVRAVRNFKETAHHHLPHYVVFVGRSVSRASPYTKQTYQVITFMHCHLAARASILNVDSQAGELTNVDASDLLNRSHFIRTTDTSNGKNALWGNIYGFQATDPLKQEALWTFIESVLQRWGSSTDSLPVSTTCTSSLCGTNIRFCCDFHSDITSCSREYCTNDKGNRDDPARVNFFAMYLVDGSRVS